MPSDVTWARARAAMLVPGLALAACGGPRPSADVTVTEDARDEREDATLDVAVVVSDASDVAVDACAPRCDGVECGDDGCGGVCGACPIALSCNAGRCGVRDGGCSPGAARGCYTGSAATERVGRCRPGTQSCSPFGVWNDGCQGEVRPAPELCTNGVDDDCDGQVDESCTTVDTTTVSGRVSFDRRRPNAARSDWGPIERVNAAGFAVYAMRGETQIGATVTDARAGEEGRFTLRVPAALTPDDRIVVAAITEGESGALDLAIVSPELARGAWPAFRRSTTMPPRAWSWSWNTAEVTAGGADVGLHISESSGSGMANVFDVARTTVATARAAFRELPRRSLLLWMAPGVEWSCGACCTAETADAFGQGFAGQISFPSGDDQTQWSSAVVAHEVGHWVMNSYGVSPLLGGAHSFNMALAPGLAWSEGYATWFGAIARNDSLYLDRQRGTMFWSDIAARRFGLGGEERSPWSLPDPRSGLLQGISEEEVAAILWAIEPTGSRDALHRAFVSPRMTRGPFARGYVTGFGGSRPVLPDFLDALACSGTPAARIDAATRGNYPYPSSAPDCRVGSMSTNSPLELSWRLERGPERVSDGSLRATLVARAEQRAWLPGPLHAALTVPSTVRIEGDSSPWTLDATGPNTVRERRFTVRYSADTMESLLFTVSARDASMGVHGEALWRWGQAAPSVPVLLANGPALRVRGRDLGASVSMRAAVALIPACEGAVGRSAR